MNIFQKLTNVLLEEYCYSRKNSTDVLANFYQNQCRIYLDEYENQKEENFSWLRKREIKKFVIGWTIARLIGEPYISDIPVFTVIDKLIENNFDTKFIRKRFEERQ